MKAKKDGKIKNFETMDGMPDSGEIVPGMGHPDSSGRCWTSAFIVQNKISSGHQHWALSLNTMALTWVNFW